MSNNGWGACSACHPFGLTDNVVWIFPSGPKRTIPQHTDFDQTDALRHTIRALNWSAERDEEADFELNIRAVSGGHGSHRGGRRRHTGTECGQSDPGCECRPESTQGTRRARWDAIEAYVQSGIRAPISPLRGSTDPDIAAGRQAFIQANCQSCHGGAQWTSGRVRSRRRRTRVLFPRAVDRRIAARRYVRSYRRSTRSGRTERRSIGADGFVPPSLFRYSRFRRLSSTTARPHRWMR